MDPREQSAYKNPKLRKFPNIPPALYGYKIDETKHIFTFIFGNKITKKQKPQECHAQAHKHIHKSIMELTTEFTLTTRLGEPLISDGKSKIESNAGAR